MSDLSSDVDVGDDGMFDVPRPLVAVHANPRGRDTRRYYQFAPGFSGAPLSKHVGHTGYFAHGERGSLAAIAKERFVCSCGQSFAAPRRSFRPWSSPQDNPGEHRGRYRVGDLLRFAGARAGLS
jgi:hypothetical protein